MTDALTEDQIKTFAAAWYLALDQHVPTEEAAALVADDVRMKFPEGEFNGVDGFLQWYRNVIGIFFDENHNVVSVDSTIRGDEADVRVIVAWQASWFEPPAPKSKRTSLNATQDWKVRRSTKNPYGIEVTFYDATAEPFKYAPGFATL